MTVNSYFRKNQANEIKLFQKLVTESIQVIGHDVYYLPRKMQKLDLILGEDTLSKFDLAIPIEMYMKKDNWVDDKDMLSKFGLMVDDNVQYSVSKERWINVMSNYPNRIYTAFNRPQEGDLVYEVMNKNLYEITYVDRDNPYYQMGTNLMYVLSCKPYVYSSERIETGISSIDMNKIEELDADMMNFELKTEDDSNLLQENDDTILLNGSQRNDNFDKTESFNSESLKEEWDKNNPFA